MKRKNSISLFLIAVIAMLTVYYINVPDKNNTLEVDNNITYTSDDVDVFATERLNLETSREERISELKLILADSTVSMTEKNTSLTELEKLDNLIDQENSFETMLIDEIGYADVFVYADTYEKVVTVSIFSDSHSVTEANQVIIKTKSEFGIDYDVVISFVADEEATE